MANELAWILGFAGLTGVGMFFYFESFIFQVLDFFYIAFNTVFATLMVFDNKTKEVMPK